MKIGFFIKCLCITIVLCLMTACDGTAGGTQATEGTGGGVEISGGDVHQSITAEKMPEAPEVQAAARGDYIPAGGETTVVFTDGGADISGDGAAFSEGELLLSRAGAYILRGIQLSRR